MPESSNADFLEAFPSRDSQQPGVADTDNFAPENVTKISSPRSQLNDVRATTRPKRALTAFETYVRFEMMLSSLPTNEKQLTIEESEFHWREWTSMPLWKKQVYQDLAAADENRYKKELQVWQDNTSAASKVGDFFKARLFQKKVTSFQQARSNATKHTEEDRGM